VIGPDHRPPVWPRPEPGALAGIRICDFTGQLAGAGATKILAQLGAEVIRIEDPVRQGRWDILRGTQPFVGDHRGIEAGGSFNNHNAGKLGITLNLRDDRAKDLLRELVAASDAVTENFAAGVMERLGFGYEALRAMKPDIVYVSNCGFGADGPYASFRSWGPIAQAVSGLTFQSGLPDLPPAGWGYSFMDHTGAYYMAMATLMALYHRRRTGEGQWVDLACIEAAGTLHGAASLDFTVNRRPARRDGMPHSNRCQSPAMAPHGIWACDGDDQWVAIAVRNDGDWERLAEALGEPWAADERWVRLAGLALLAVPVVPFIGLIPPFAAAAPLIIVGAATVGLAREIEWDDMDTAVPALFVMAGMPLMFSIADGLAMGVVSYSALKILRGHAGRVSWLVHALAALFVARFVLLG